MRRSSVTAGVSCRFGVHGQEDWSRHCQRLESDRKGFRGAGEFCYLLCLGGASCSDRVQIPNWPPGCEVGYHAITYGWLVDQVVRRTDPKKRSVGVFFKEEIAEKYS